MYRIIFCLSFFLFYFNLTAQNVSFLRDSSLTYKYSEFGDSLKENKVYFDYDENGNLISEEAYGWNSTFKEWIGGNKTEYQYDSIGNLVTTVDYLWDYEEKDWNYNSKTFYEYNSKLLVHSQTTQKWNNQEWVDNLKKEFNYDSLGFCYFTQELDWDSIEWKQIKYSNISFDSIERFSIDSSFYADGTLNMVMMVKRNSYNEIEWFEYLVWSESQGDFWAGSRGEFTYDSIGNQTKWIDKSWDRNSSDWKNFFEIYSFYDVCGKITFEKTWLWDRTNGIYKHLRNKWYFYSDYYFSEEINICKPDSFYWQGEYLLTSGEYIKQFTSADCRDSTYLLNLTVNDPPSNFEISGQDLVDEYSITQYSSPFIDSVNYLWNVHNGQIISFIENNIIDVKWNSFGSGFVSAVAQNQFGCFSDTSYTIISIGDTQIDKPGVSSISIFPNPASDFISIKLSDECVFKRIYVYDLNGNRKKQINYDNHKVNNDFILNISDLPPGLFIVEFFNENSSRKYLFMKK